MTSPYVPGRLREAETLRVIVFGGTGVGKTSFVNDASGSNLQIGHGLPSCTKEVQAGPIFTIRGRAIQLFDTPGFDDTVLTDTEILRSIAELLLDLHVSKMKITGVLYLHRITDNRMSGASVRALSLFEKICGIDAMRNAVIVTNMWSFPRDPQEEVRENQLKSEYFAAAIRNGAKVARRGNGSGSASAILELLLDCAPITLQIQTEMAVQRLQLDETDAGALVDQNLRRRLERQQQEKMELEEELSEAISDRDRRAQEQLERFKRDKEDEMKRLQEQLDALHQAKILQHQIFNGPTESEDQPPVKSPNQPSKPGRGFGWGRRKNQRNS